MGLPKLNRLKSPREFQAVYQRGQRYQSDRLVLRVLWITDKTSNPAPTQFGIAISQKVSKKAVVRNRLKRQIKGAIRVLLPFIAPGAKIVISVRGNVSECQYEHFLRELKKLLIKAKIIYGHTREYFL
ncbi:ribonuclease P protein component [Rippkaea orientalis PCC 8801]|uniref:Ribonuclease P protein component n=1 Tax=Rippkaea orientalis (strain PCC 8801 / RF-1) TaxID=41431 RepID=RNPA_RIPO1|nr:ribonuclease P protein component [Rippkaea orientalis]B7K5U5.1 RecName: Full=Ribonuclease P protein component; Short=RNase P protein; Short=RNaseP protein; AltName: Full=Protein C5 [Rippkaea orientalis PCC 8801]ACK67998.1 ribonuclease P protein component [Rippkaea orientalis PCC 8801]